MYSIFNNNKVCNILGDKYILEDEQNKICSTTRKNQAFIGVHQ